MHLAFIILTHSDPAQLSRLIKRINHPAHTFFIHVDKRVNLEPFIESTSSLGAKVFFVEKREVSSWGGIGLVKATLNALTQIVNHTTRFESVSLLSGADYPIKSLNEIRSFLVGNIDKCFLTYQKLPNLELDFGGLDRINYYSFNVNGKRETALPFSWVKQRSFKGKFLNMCLNGITLILPKRTIPYDWTVYYGSQWWTLSYDACVFICDYNQNHPEILKYFKWSNIPDELFFQTILLNAYPSVELLINDNKRSIDFGPGTSHPRVFDEKDLELLLTSNDLFGRKFESKSQILDLLDEKKNEDIIQIGICQSM